MGDWPRWRERGGRELFYHNTKELELKLVYNCVYVREKGASACAAMGEREGVCWNFNELDIQLQMDNARMVV